MDLAQDRPSRVSRSLTSPLAPSSLASEVETWTRRWRRVRLLDDLARIGGLVTVAAFLAYAVDRPWEIPSLLRVVLLVAASGGLAVWARRRSSWRVPSAASYLASLCQESGALALLVSGVEFSREPGRGESPTLRAATMRAAEGAWRQLDAGAPIRTRTGRSRTWACSGIAALGLVAGLGGGDETSAFLTRCILLRSVEYPRHTHARIVGPLESIEIVEGDDLRVEIAVEGERVEDVWLRIRELDRPSAQRRVKAIRSSSGAFVVVVASMTRDAEIAAVAGDDDDFEPRRFVRVLARPHVQNLELVVRPPAYANQPTRTRTGGQVDALPGARVTVRVRPSVPLTSASLVASWDEGLEMSRDSSDHWSSTFVVQHAGRYRVRLVDEHGVASSHEPMWDVTLKEDHPPEALLDWRGFGREITPDARLELTVWANDDFGLASLDLEARAGERSSRQPIAIGLDRPLRSLVPWSPSADWKVGDDVELALVAHDHRDPDPQWTRSSGLRLRAVSAPDLLRRLLDALADVRSRLDADLPASVQANDASDLDRLAISLRENRIGGERLQRAARDAASALRSASEQATAAKRAPLVQRAVDALAIVSDWGELTWRLEELIEAQGAVVRRLRFARRELSAGRALDVAWFELAREERALSDRARSFGSALEHLMMRQPSGQASEAVRAAAETWGSDPADRILDATAEALDRVDLLGALQRGEAALKALEAIAALWGEVEETALVGRQETDGERGPASLAGDLLKELESIQAEASTGEALSDEELERLLAELEALQEELASAQAADPDRTASEEEAASESEEAAKEATEESKRALRNARMARTLELQREGLTATRRAMHRAIEALKRRFGEVAERDASREQLGQNLSGETIAERLRPGSASGLFPESTPERAKERADRWGGWKKREPVDLDAGGEREAIGIDFDALRRHYYRALAGRERSR